MKNWLEYLGVSDSRCIAKSEKFLELLERPCDGFFFTRGGDLSVVFADGTLLQYMLGNNGPVCVRAHGFYRVN